VAGDLRSIVTKHAAERFAEARYGVSFEALSGWLTIDDLQAQMCTPDLLVKVRSKAARHHENGITFIIKHGVVITVLDGKRRRPRRVRGKTRYVETQGRKRG